MRKVRKCQERRCKIQARIRANRLKKFNLHIKKSKLYIRRKKRKSERESEPLPFVGSAVRTLANDDSSIISSGIDDCCRQSSISSSSSENVTATSMSIVAARNNERCSNSGNIDSGGSGGNDIDALVTTITSIDRTANMRRVARRIVLDCLVRLVRTKFPTITRRNMFKNLKFFAKMLYLLVSSVGMANALIQIINSVISD